MAVPGTETRRARGGAESGTPGAPALAGLGTILLLATALGIAAFAVLAAVVLAVTSPTVLAPPLGEQHQNAETILYLAAFGLILPVSVLLAQRIATRVEAGPNAAGLPALAWGLTAALLAVLVAAKASSRLPWGDGIGVVAAGTGAWLGVAAAAIWRAAQPRRWGALLRLSRGLTHLQLLTGVFAVIAVLCFADVGSLSLGVVAVGAIAIPLGLAAYSRWRGRSLPRRAGALADAAIVVLILLVVPNLVIFRPEQAATDFDAAFQTWVIQFHQNFILGPANVVTHGGAVLVDTASQYGIGPIYLLAGWFQLAPQGYGTYGLLDCLLTALFFASAYAVMRMAGTPRLLCAAAMATAIVALVLNLAYPVGALPQQGPLRFGLPIALVLAYVAGSRWRPAKRAARIAGLAIVGLSSVWALEAFAYTVATFAALTAFQLWERAPGARRSWLVEQALGALLACIAAQLLLVGLTVLLAGRLPDYGQYFAFLDAFLFGSVGDINYDFSAWAPGLAVGAGYFASASALLLVLMRSPGLVRRERTTFLAITGTTSYGIVLFSYFVDRSADHILPYVCLPLVVAATLWLGLLLRLPEVAERARFGALAFGLVLAALLVSFAWSSVGDRFPQTALARALPGGEGLRASLDRLWHTPPLNPRAPEGEALLNRYMPGRESVPIVVPPDLQIEILVRSGRTDAFGLSDPIEDSFVPKEYQDDLDRAVARLRPGSLILTDRRALRAVSALPRHSRSAALLNPAAVAALAPLQQYLLARIAQRFLLRPLHRDREGFVVARLVRRR
jgi:hypothetical protein